MGNLWRLLRVLVAARFARPRPMLETSVIRLRVWLNDLDVNLHMNNGRYLSLMDLGRVDLMVRGGLGHWFRRGWQPLVAASFCRYFKPLNLGQSFDLRTRVLGWDEKWLYIEHRFMRLGRLHALAVVKALVSERGRLLPSAELLGYTGSVPAQSPEIPDWVRQWLASERQAIDQLKAESAAPKAESGGPA
jgi:acyl-CoA thioesterase FadM